MNTSNKYRVVMLASVLSIAALTVITARTERVAAGQPRTRLLNQVQQVNELNFELNSISRLGDNIELRWCYQMPDPDNSDYVPKGITVKAGETVLEGNLMLDEWRFANGATMSKDQFVSPESASTWKFNGRVAQRCDRLTFQSPSVLNAKTLEVSVAGIGMPAIPESMTCDEMRAQVSKRNLPFDLECDIQPYEIKWRVSTFPQNMTQDQAQRIAYEAIIDYRPGPWTFTATLP